MLGVGAMLAGCSTVTKINLFEPNDYIMTTPPALVDGKETKQPGVWLSKDAVMRLQNANVIAGQVK